MVNSNQISDGDILSAALRNGIIYIDEDHEMFYVWLPKDIKFDVVNNQAVIRNTVNNWYVYLHNDSMPPWRLRGKFVFLTPEEQEVIEEMRKNG